MGEASTTGRHISTQQAAFIGVAAMVGAGIFSLLGAAGEVAGAAVWLSFLLAGGIAALQGYSFAKLGAEFPSAGGLLEYVNQGFGDGHVATVVGLADLHRERHRDGDGRPVVRELRELGVRGRRRRLGEDLRRRPARDDDPASTSPARRSSPGSRASSSSSSSASWRSSRS